MTSNNEPKSTLFAKLRASGRIPIKPLPTDTTINIPGTHSSPSPRASNTTHANSISLTAGSLIVGSASKKRDGRRGRSSDEKTKINNNGGNGNGNGIDNSKSQRAQTAIDTDRLTSPTATDRRQKYRKHQLEIGYHESRVSENLVLLNLGSFTDISEGDLCELLTYNDLDSGSNNSNKNRFAGGEYCNGTNVGVNAGVSHVSGSVGRNGNSNSIGNGNENGISENNGSYVHQKKKKIYFIARDFPPMAKKLGLRLSNSGVGTVTATVSTGAGTIGSSSVGKAVGRSLSTKSDLKITNNSLSTTISQPDGLTNTANVSMDTPNAVIGMDTSLSSSQQRIGQNQTQGQRHERQVTKPDTSKLISVASGQLQSLLDLPPRSKVWVKKKDKERYASDLVEINIRDIHLNRGDIWIFSSQLVDTCVFNNQRLTFNNIIRGTVKGIYRDGKKLLSGYVNEATRVVFRSESAKLIFIIQITEEMWNFEENGEQMFQKMVNSLLPKIFKKWKAVDTHHSITIAFAISMDFSDTSFKDLKPGERLKNPADYFRVVVDQVNIIHWVRVLQVLKTEFQNIRSDLLNHVTDKGYTVVKGRFAPVIKSNILELVNFATTLLVDPFRQMDLRHTTTHVMIITPGSGLYDVDYDLLNLTGRKLLSLEMTMDLVCLSSAPLHVVPLFRCLDYQNNLHYCVPNWLSIFFWNDTSKNAEEWHPRCKIYDLQMMGLANNELLEDQVYIPYLKPSKKDVTSVLEFINEFDNHVFKSINLKDLNAPNNHKRATVPSKNRYTAARYRIESDISRSTRSVELPKLHRLNTQPLALSSDYNFVLKNLTYSRPVIDDAQKLDVIANLNVNGPGATTLNGPGTMGDSPSISDTESASYLLTQSPDVTNPVSATESGQSLALSALKGLTKKNSVKEFTRRLMKKIGGGISPTGSAVAEKPSNTFTGNERERTDFVDTGSRLRGQDITIKKNLSIFEQDRGNKSIDRELDHQATSPSSGLITRRSSIIQQQYQAVHSSEENRQNRHSISSNHSLSLDSKFSFAISHGETTTARENLYGHIYSGNETWIEIKNPSVTLTKDLTHKLSSVRWKDVWPYYVAKKYIKWRSFATPAELPTTISAFPTLEDFENNFIFRNHSVTLNTDKEYYDQTSMDLLRNMVYTRLVAGFQICVGEQVELVEQSRTGGKEKISMTKYLRNDKPWESIQIYMMIDSEIHRISCGRNGTIDVERYIRNEKVDPYLQVPSYIPLVKTRYETKYRDSMIDPVHSRRPSLNWNQVDQVLAGYGEYIVDRKWHGFRAKFVILPSDVPASGSSMVINGKNETLTPEELRVEGFRRLVTSIVNLKLGASNDGQQRRNKKDEIQPEIMFYTGSLGNFIEEQQDALKPNGVNFKDFNFEDDANLLDKNVELHKLANELQFSDRKLTLTSRRWHWQRHKNSFVGSEMVSWLVNNFRDIETRAEALEYGQSLMDRGLFTHVLNKHGFLDGHYFYQFKSEYSASPNALQKVTSHGTSTSDLISPVRNMSVVTIPDTMQLSLMRSRNSVASRDDRSNVQTYSPSQQSTGTRKPVVVLSNSVVINVDPLGKSCKQESCTVHYDRIHSPDHCFHIRVEWLTTTPKLLDDLIGSWCRICDRYGLKLIEIPWEELCLIPVVNPFHSFVHIKLAIDPWTDPEFADPELFSKNKFYYHLQLLRQNGFLLDSRSTPFISEKMKKFDIVYSWGRPEFQYAQFVHNTGAYILELRENGDLFLAPNNLHISREIPGLVNKKYTPSKFVIAAMKVMPDFKDMCTSYPALRRVFLEIKEKWLSSHNPEDY